MHGLFLLSTMHCWECHILINASSFSSTHACYLVICAAHLGICLRGCCDIANGRVDMIALAVRSHTTTTFTIADIIVYFIWVTSVRVHVSHDLWLPTATKHPPTIVCTMEHQWQEQLSMQTPKQQIIENDICWINQPNDMLCWTDQLRSSHLQSAMKSMAGLWAHIANLQCRCATKSKFNCIHNGMCMHAFIIVYIPICNRVWSCKTSPWAIWHRHITCSCESRLIVWQKHHTFNCGRSQLP